MDVDQSEKEEFDDRYDYFLIALNYILSGWPSFYNAMISSVFKIAPPAVSILRSLTAGGIIRNILIVSIKANLHQPDKK